MTKMRVICTVALIGFLGGWPLACSTSTDAPAVYPGGAGGAGVEAGNDGAAALGGSSGSHEAGQSGEGGEGGQSAASGSGGSGGGSGSAGSATAGTGGAGGGPACDKHWSREVCPNVDTTPGASVDVSVKGGALLLTETLTPFMCGSVTLPAYSLKVYQPGLSGDFKVVFNFDSFAPAAYGAGVHAYVGAMDSDNDLAEATLMLNGASYDLKVSITHNAAAQEDVKSTSNTAGTLTFQRTSGLLTVTASAGGDSKNLSGLFSDANLRVGFALQGPFNAPSPVASSSVRLLEFQVTGGGGTVVNDTFDCDSVH